MTDDSYTYSGTFTGSQFGGPGSHFTQHVTTSGQSAAGPDPDLVRLEALLADLMTRVAARSDEIDHPERAGRDAQELLDEAARPAAERDTSRIADAFRRLRDRLRPVADFADSLAKLADLLTKFLPS
ncbi:hypothetical protein HCN51_37615 [Nonomuraea sp. FMUSA5-5]|uniref:Uncharacterized protein n=1 Tax=Nonomuraea composti TaxID=2720023 RepID=A0ABX1BBE2_9ACTN|nr:hypothetical protein [Nonomuraea sp. FMUSA5-5]NJP95095.1 hypothetical protein [Nonomuraea sp. FMUSA5-5]